MDHLRSSQFTLTLKLKFTKHVVSVSYTLLKLEFNLKKCPTEITQIIGKKEKAVQVSQISLKTKFNSGKNGEQTTERMGKVGERVDGRERNEEL